MILSMSICQNTTNMAVVWEIYPQNHSLATGLSFVERNLKMVDSSSRVCYRNFACIRCMFFHMTHSLKSEVHLIHKARNHECLNRAPPPSHPGHIEIKNRQNGWPHYTYTKLRSIHHFKDLLKEGCILCTLASYTHRIMAQVNLDMTDHCTTDFCL